MCTNVSQIKKYLMFQEHLNQNDFAKKKKKFVFHMTDCLVGRLNTALICSVLSKAPISDRLHGCPRSYRKQTALQGEHTTEVHCHAFLLHALSANGSIHVSVRGNACVCPPSNLRQGAQLQPCQCLYISICCTQAVLLKLVHISLS